MKKIKKSLLLETLIQAPPYRFAKKYPAYNKKKILFS